MAKSTAIPTFQLDLPTECKTFKINIESSKVYFASVLRWLRYMYFLSIFLRLGLPTSSGWTVTSKSLNAVVHTCNEYKA